MFSSWEWLGLGRSVSNADMGGIVFLPFCVWRGPGIEAHLTREHAFEEKL